MWIIILAGYPKFSTFGVSIGSRTNSGRREYVTYHKNSITTSSLEMEMKEIEEIARELKIFIVTGFIERDDTNGGGTLYCSVAFISPDHGLVYSRRKVS